MKDRRMSRFPIKHLTQGMVLLVVLMLGILYPVAHEGIAKPLTITIVHTNNVAGHLFACPT